MSNYEFWSLVTGFGTIVVALGGLLAVWYQVRLGRLDRAADSAAERKRLEADHDQRRKQVTIEYLNQVRSTWRTDRKDIEAVTRKGALDQNGLNKLKRLTDL